MVKKKKRILIILILITLLLLIAGIIIFIYKWNLGINLTAKYEVENLETVYKIRYNPIANYSIKKILKFNSEELAESFASSYNEINKYLDNEEKIQYTLDKKKIIVTFDSFSDFVEEINFDEENITKENLKEFFKSEGYKISL